MEFEFSAGILVYRYRASKREFLFLENPEGWLDLPKGHIEKGESAIEAAVRETAEESGLSIEPDRFFREGMAYWFIRDRVKVKKTLIVFIGMASADSKVKISDEHTGYRWLELETAMHRLKFKNQIELVKNGAIYLDKAERLKKLNTMYSDLCAKQGDWQLSRNFVPGEGRADANVMLVGQAPGAEEDAEGRPFVGRSGSLLDKLIKKAGLSRDGLYITSVVQFFPPKNRVPSDPEIALCVPFLMRQIEIVDPKLVVLLGAVAAKAVAGVESVSKAHGTLVERRGRKFFITLHPAAAVRISTNMPLIESDFIKLKSVIKRIE
jgi:DNA polymerase